MRPAILIKVISYDTVSGIPPGPHHPIFQLLLSSAHTWTVLMCLGPTIHCCYCIFTVGGSPALMSSFEYLLCFESMVHYQNFSLLCTLSSLGALLSLYPSSPSSLACTWQLNVSWGKHTHDDLLDSWHWLQEGPSAAHMLPLPWVTDCFILLSSNL